MSPRGIRLRAQSQHITWGHLSRIYFLPLTSHTCHHQRGGNGSNTFSILEWWCTVLNQKFKSFLNLLKARVKLEFDWWNAEEQFPPFLWGISSLSIALRLTTQITGATQETFAEQNKVLFYSHCGGRKGIRQAILTPLRPLWPMIYSPEDHRHWYIILIVVTNYPCGCPPLWRTSTGPMLSPTFSVQLPFDTAHRLADLHPHGPGSHHWRFAWWSSRPAFRFTITLITHLNTPRQRTPSNKLPQQLPLDPLISHDVLPCKCCFIWCWGFFFLTSFYSLPKLNKVTEHKTADGYIKENTVLIRF